MPGWVYDWDTESPLCQEAPFFRVSPARCHQEAAGPVCNTLILLGFQTLLWGEGFRNVAEYIGHRPSPAAPSTVAWGALAQL